MSVHGGRGGKAAHHHPKAKHAPVAKGKDGKTVVLKGARPSGPPAAPDPPPFPPAQLPAAAPPALSGKARFFPWILAGCAFLAGWGFSFVDWSGFGLHFGAGKIGEKAALSPVGARPYLVDLVEGWRQEAVGPNLDLLSSPDGRAVMLVTYGLSIVAHRELTAPWVSRYSHLRGAAPDKYVSLMRLSRKRVAVTVMGDHPGRVAVYRSIREAPTSGMGGWRAN